MTADVDARRGVGARDGYESRASSTTAHVRRAETVALPRCLARARRASAVSVRLVARAGRRAVPAGAELRREEAGCDDGTCVQAAQRKQQERKSGLRDHAAMRIVLVRIC